VFADDSDVFSIEVKDANDVVTRPTIDNVFFLSEFALSSADVLAALASNSAAVVINGTQITGTAFLAMASAFDLTAAGSIDTTLGSLTAPTLTGSTAVTGNIASTGVTISVSGGAVNSQLVAERTGANASKLSMAAQTNNPAISYESISGSGLQFLHDGVTTTAKLNDAGDFELVTGTLQVTAGTAGIGVAAPAITALSGTANVSNTVLKVVQDSVTGRSINASGTINASAADVAEYMRLKNVLDKIAKGAIVGFDSDGLIVTRFSEAVSFGVKSTNPNLVGGDTWSDSVGERPLKPELEFPDYTGSELPEAVAKPKKEENQTQWLIYNEALSQFEADQQDYTDILKPLQDELAAVLMPQYLLDLKSWEEELEEARQTVDRIAFCGVVPVNDALGDPGDFIIPIQGPDDTITGKAVAKVDMTLDDSLERVGRILKIEDGRSIILVSMG